MVEVIWVVREVKIIRLVKVVGVIWMVLILVPGFLGWSLGP